MAQGPASDRARQRRAQKRAAAKARARQRLRIRSCPRHSDRLISIEGDSASNDLQKVQDGTKMMLENGWCSHQVRHLSRKFDPTTFAHLAELKRGPPRTTEHQQCLYGENCVAYNTEPNTYRTQHTTPGCECELVCVPYESVLKVIRKGRVPLVSIVQGGRANERFKLRVCARERGSKYTAISHVWIDGLGNPRVNGLPSCQLERLSRSLLALQQGNNLFWMDTLCIPVGPDEIAYRFAQIDNMASIYKGASHSLVLDAELMNATYIHDNALSRLTRSPYLYTRRDLYALLACSAWSTRSWTLQEGRLPNNIAVQFSDSIVVFGRNSREDGEFKIRQLPMPTEASRSGSSVEDSTLPAPHKSLPLLSSLSTTEMNEQCDCADIALERDFYNSYFAGDESHELTRKFINVWDELSGRSTTMPEDVPMIIANMLNLDSSGLLSCDAEEMFLRVLLSLNTIPIGVFFNHGPRQNSGLHHLNRWVPTKIGSFGLESSASTLCPRVKHDCLEIDYSIPAGRQAFGVYTIDATVSLTSEVRLRMGKLNVEYLIRPCIDRADEFRFDDFKSTYFMVEYPSSQETGNTLRGACFFSPGDVLQEDSDIDLTFYCPLELEKVSPTLLIQLEDAPMYTVEPLKPCCKLRIQYDPLSDFKPLRLRGQYGYSTNLTRALLLVLYLLPFTLLFRYGWSPGLSLALFLFMYVMFPISVFVVQSRPFMDLAESLEGWNNVRSFEIRREIPRDIERGI